jgi:hypothetical protein
MTPTRRATKRRLRKEKARVTAGQRKNAEKINREGAVDNCDSIQFASTVNPASGKETAE